MNRKTTGVKKLDNDELMRVMGGFELKGPLVTSVTVDDEDDAEELISPNDLFEKDLRIEPLD